MWAAGIIAYRLLFGKHPLDEATYTRHDMELKLKNFTEVEFPPDSGTVSD
jgi:hypothetical protein